MNAAGLLEHYERIADAPDAVAKLRRLILQLAVRGKLVVQDLNHEPASELKLRIDAASARRAAIGSKSPKPNEELVTDEEKPFDVPLQWRFVRLGGILDMYNGRAFKPSEWIDSGLPIVRIQNLNNPTAS